MRGSVSSGCVFARVVLAALAMPATGVFGDAPDRVLVDRSLKRHAIRELTIDTTSVQFRDDAGRATRLSRADVLALLPIDATDAPATPGGEPLWREIGDIRTEASGRLELLDGQIYPGRIGGSVEGGAPTVEDSVAWEHPRLGIVRVPLDHIALALLRRDYPPARIARPGSSGDVVGLRNHDRLDAFVSALGEDVGIEIKGRTTTIATDRVAYVRFAGTPAAPDGMRAWLRDTSVLRLSRLTTASGSWDIGVDGQAAPVALADADVVAVNFDAAAIRPLAAATYSVIPSSGDRYWTPPPILADPLAAPMGLSDISLPGPMTIEWALPAGASRVACQVELPLHSRRLGDCTLIIESGGTKLASERLYADRPRAEVSVAIPHGATRLRATLDPGATGPIQDFLVLHRAMLAVSNGP